MSFFPDYKFDKIEVIHSIFTFQNGKSKTTKTFLRQNNLMVRIFLKDAYFSISLHQKLKYVRFQWKGNLFQFSWLCFSLGLAPWIFTKLLKIPISMLLRINIELIIYLDDILIMGRSLEEILMSQDKVIFLLQHLGFVRNLQESKLDQTQNSKFWR